MFKLVAGVREVVVPMPASVSSEDNTQEIDLQASSQSCTPRTQSALSFGELDVDVDPPRVYTTTHIFKSPDGKTSQHPSCAPLNSSGDFVTSLLSPLGEWLGGQPGDGALCARPAAHLQSRSGLLVRPDGAYPPTKPRPARRGPADDDCGCGGGRRCAGCAAAWDADHDRCPVCGRGVGATGRGGFGCDGDGARRGVQRGHAPPVAAPTAPGRADACFYA
jgi:hypothetical protein